MKSKEQKREEAAERQAAHDALTTLEKLTKASSRGGGWHGQRERVRLIASQYA